MAGTSMVLEMIGPWGVMQITRILGGMEGTFQFPDAMRFIPLKFKRLEVKIDQK